MLLDFVVALVLFAVCTVTQVFDIYDRYMNPYLTYILTGLIGLNGLVLYYFIPQLSKHHPWKVFRIPFLDRTKLPNRIASKIRASALYKKYIAKWLGDDKVPVGHQNPYNFLNWIWFEYGYHVLRWVEVLLWIILVQANITPLMIRFTTKIPNMYVLFLY
jgi:hypothetical protein